MEEAESPHGPLPQQSARFIVEKSAVMMYNKLLKSTNMTEDPGKAGLVEVFMNNKGVGTVFCLISAILLSARYIAAAIFMSNVSSWDSSLFQAGLSYVGSPLKVMAVLALIVGVCFLGYGVFTDSKKTK